MNSRFCSQCGKDLSQLGEIAFCPECGANVRQQFDPAQMPAQQPYDQPPSAPYTVLPTYASSPVYGASPARRSHAGAIIAGCTAGVIVLAALVLFLIGAISLGGGYSGDASALSGTWDAVLQIEKVAGTGSDADAIRTRIGEHFDQELRLSLSDNGRGTAELFESASSSGEMSVELKQGKLTLALDSEGAGHFSFAGTVSKDGKTIEGTFAMTVPGENKIDVKGTFEAKKGIEPSGMPDKPAEEETLARPQPAPETTQAPMAGQTPAPAAEPADVAYGDFLRGGWLSEPYPDGMSDAFIFSPDGSCTNTPTVREGNGTDGWLTGEWYTEDAIDGTYAIDGNELTVNWIQADYSRTYTVEIIGENTMRLTEHYDGGSITMEYVRVPIQ